MRAVKQDTEQRLNEALAAIKPNRNSWRAQIFHFAQLKDKSVATLMQRVAFGIITEKLAGKEGFIFFLHDDDLLVLGNMIVKKQFDDIAAAVEQIFTQEGYGSTTRGLTELLDLSVNWESLLNLAYAKKQALDAKQKARPLVTTTTKSVPEKIIFDPSTREHLLQQGKAQRQARQKPCILLVEDDPLSLHLAKKTLMDDYTVITAVDGTRAREAYLMHVPDVVFLDIGLPDISGHALLNEILALDPEAYIVMLSGQSFREAIVKAMQAGAKGFVGKPFTRAKLLHYIALANASSTTRADSTL